MSEHFEVVIVGAGPAGLSAATNAARQGVSHLLLEKREIGNTIFNYQLGKHVMAEPGNLPLRGYVPFSAGAREEVLSGWQDAVTSNKVNWRRAEVSRVRKNEELFEISSSAGQITCKHLVLSIGVQGSPRTLGVPGEELPHIAYTLSDPKAFKGMDILVVGTGDAGLENALALCDANRVALLNRTADFARAKEANIAKIMAAVERGAIKLFSNSSVARIQSDTVVINTPNGEVAHRCNHLIARLGCVLPRKFLEEIGVIFPSKEPDAVPVVNSRYESNIPRLYLLGALIGYPLIKQAINQGFEVIEHILGNQVEPADQPLIAEALKPLTSSTGMDVAAALTLIREQLPFLRDLSEPQFRELLIDSKIHCMRADDVVFRKNDYTDTFWSIVDGSVAIEIGGDNHVTLRNGEFFGEMGLLSGRRRAATVRALGRAVLIESPRKQILKLNNSVPSLRRVLDEAFMLRALSSTVFPDADPQSLREIVSHAAFKMFKKGEALFKEGEPGDALYVIRKGSVKVSRRNTRGVDVAQTYIPAGNLVGEMALLAGGSGIRSATVTAAVACETIVLSRDVFGSFLTANPVLRERLEQLATQRALENTARTQDATQGQLLDFMIAQGVTDADNFLMIDSDLCVGCDNCESACAATHKGYSRLDRKRGQSFASIQIPISCRHCENPLCMTDCPPDALTRKPNGEVVIRESCIGCGNCTRNCPYGVIQLVYDTVEEPFSLVSWLGLKKKAKGPAKAAKCDMCGSLEGGPACVRSCPTGAAMRVNPSKMLALLATKGGRS